MTFTIGDAVTKKCSYETALDLTGFGKYNIGMLVSCYLLILTMNMDIFSVSVVVPAIACDMSLNVAQQGILTAAPLISVILSSFGWGLAADMIGRRKTLLITMPIGFIMGVAASMAPSYITLTVFKFFNVMFTSAANAAALVLMGESVPRRHRNRIMFFLASATTIVLCLICSIALPLLKLGFHYEIPWLNVVYRPWRLLLQIVILPGVAAIIYLLFLEESPKFLLSHKRDQEAIVALQKIFQSNTGNKMDAYSATHVYLDETLVVNSTETSALKKIWNQIAPLFKPPLLKNSVILYYLLLCAYMTATGIAMWVPTIANAFFIGEDTTGKTFCEVASRSTHLNTTMSSDCDNVIQPGMLYAVITYSVLGSSLTILLSFIVGPLGKKKLTLVVFVVASLSGMLLLFVRIPLLSLVLLYFFLYVAQILGNVNAYLVDLNPTHLRGMASCLSVVVARGFGFFSVQIFGSFLEDYCLPMLGGYVALVISGLLVALFLPPDSQPKKSDNEEIKNGTALTENS